ncbi:hypothetical protein ABEB36_005004 [Hypothenemus hampei]|uniref:Uncharacterized protein n=1 Tax=Hypothenemus hampei TaxID=57062 RepID=A0ABD1EWP0_HYPHA
MPVNEKDCGQRGLPPQLGRSSSLSPLVVDLACSNQDHVTGNVDAMVLHGSTDSTNQKSVAMSSLPPVLFLCHSGKTRRRKHQKMASGAIFQDRKIIHLQHATLESFPEVRAD